MKVLMLTPYLPFPPFSGGQTRSYNLIKNLSKKHEITLFSLIKDDEEKKNIKELEKYCKVRVFKRSKTPWTLRNILKTGFGLYPFLVIRNLVPEEKEAVAKELSNEKYDLIHAETFYVMPHIPATSIPILMVEQTIEYSVYKHFVEDQAPFFIRPLLWIDVLKLKYWETKIWKRADKVVAMSDSDRKSMISLVPNLKIDTVPNGIDVEYFSKERPEEKGSPKVLYVGNFKWLQNVEAVQVLLSEVFPKILAKVPNAKLWIVGQYIPDEIKAKAGKDIQITEAIPDIREAYLNATVLVTPIKGPGGTRLKILEAMASALPVVTTSVGAEGLDVVNGKHALIADDMDKLADLAVRVIKDKSLAAKLGDNERKFVIENYRWQISADRLDSIYKEAVKKG
jgi:glycosyltransferase involved in cell wall biosynthesis